MKKINININPKIFNDAYLKYAIHNDKPTQIYYGGSSSGKSFAIIGQRTVLDMLKGGRNFLICRQVANTVKKSVFNEVCKAISTFNVNQFFKINKAEMTITCINGYQILFSGLDDPEKIKSVTPAKGVITDIVIEEATESTYDAYKQLTKRLRGHSNAPKRITLLFNPILKTHWIYKEFFYKWNDGDTYYEDEKLTILKTTYKDNKYLTKEDIARLEDETDPYWHNVYTLGNWGVLGNTIFNNYRVEDLSEIEHTFDNIRNGIDWGLKSVAPIYSDVYRKFSELTNVRCAA